MFGPTNALGLREGPIWVHLVIEAGHYRDTAWLGVLPRVDLGMKSVRGRPRRELTLTRVNGMR